MSTEAGQPHLIATAVFGVVCLLWTQGMSSDLDSDPDSGSSLYFDRERAAHARATGEYVWRFLIYVSVAYLALFVRWWRDEANKRPG
jgi:hypothetical protein